MKRLLSWIAAAAAGVGTYARFVEPRWLEVTRTHVRVPGLPPALDGLRLALLTDFHAGRLTPLARVRRACRLAMAERPDLVAITGDFISEGDHDLPEVVALLDAELAAPLGVYAVPGNHDHASGIADWYRQVGRHPAIRNLTNVVEVRRRGEATIWIAGTDDLDTGDPRPERVIPQEVDPDLTIVLTHNPDMAEEACRVFERVDLVVSGHTHGGQIRLPFIGPVENPARHAVYEAGLYRRPWSQVYVSRGVGTVRLPIRFLTRPEVAILELLPGR